MMTTIKTPELFAPESGGDSLSKEKAENVAF